MQSFDRNGNTLLKAVIFDWAGTIIDYGCQAPVNAFLEAFALEGVSITREEARAPMGIDKKEHIRRILEMPSVAARWEQAHGAPWTESSVEDLYEWFTPNLPTCIVGASDLIPGLLSTVEHLRGRGIAIGTTTGYSRPMLNVAAAEADVQGFAPDASVCVSDVPAGRPAPWMCLRNMELLGVYPPSACVKVGDTVVDIQEGLNAGMWTVGVTKTGNGLGLTPDEIGALGTGVLEERLAAAERTLATAGAHYVIEGVWDLPGILDVIERRMGKGEKP